jgi:hypothetical protein
VATPVSLVILVNVCTIAFPFPEFVPVKPTWATTHVNVVPAVADVKAIAVACPEKIVCVIGVAITFAKQVPGDDGEVTFIVPTIGGQS